jgi:magnesium-transporting ATPase (P-type)
MGKKQQEVDAALKNHVSGQSNKPLSKPAHALKHEEVIAEIKTNPDDGLTAAEATSRVQEYGRNEIGDQGGVNVTKILVRQIANAMILVLLLAMGVSFGIGSYVSLYLPCGFLKSILMIICRSRVVSLRLSFS